MPVRRAIWQGTQDETERKRLFTALKTDQWRSGPVLQGHKRRRWKHGQSKVNHQIILDSDCYNTFELGGRAWLKVQSLERGKRIASPLNTTVRPTGTIRLLLREGRVAVQPTLRIRMPDTVFY